jgi:predicted HAD superfamily Cof-like phosphohydrolase
MSNFEKVVDFNKTFGVKTHTSPQLNIFDADPSLVSLRMKLIREEVKELEEAVSQKDMTETVDALTDILYVVYGAGSSFGIDMDKAFDIVHSSNMSKTCETITQAEETVDWYNKNSEKYNEENPAQAPIKPAIRKSEDDKLFVVYNETTGKVLKSIYYTAAKFNSLLE